VSSPFLEQVNRTPITFCLLVAYLSLGVVTGLAEPDTAKLMRFGAATAHAVQFEPWRLLAYSFLHGGLLHLAMNSIFLFIIGPMLEQSLGSVRFCVLYVVAAIGGGIGGCLWHNPFAPLVGGSGALFGMAGAVVATHMRQGRHLLDFLNYRGPRLLVMLIVANLIFGMVSDIVSNAGHIGGLIAGFALTFCFLERGREPADRASRAVQAGWIALFASLVFYCINPVVRLDYLLLHYDQASSAPQRTAYARAAVNRAGNASTLQAYIAILLRDNTQQERMAFWDQLLRSAAGR
jgi:membrane associated rhomboid family serine protease